MNDRADSELPIPQVEHVSVLLSEALDLLRPRQGGVYLDGTLGAGGHAEEILKRSSPDGILIGLDQDAEAMERSAKRLAAFGSRAVIRHANYRDAAAVLADAGYDALDGALLDLGVSAYHLRTPGRGFSFSQEGPLDMRMDRSRPRSAADLVNTLPPGELAKIIREYGEERKAGAIARAVEKARSRGPITTTVQLAEIVASVFPPFLPRRIHPATRTFQALRIAVNEELEALREGIEAITGLLRSGGRIVVISFHSLEDRIVKQFFALQAKGCSCPPRLPQCICGGSPVLKVLTKRPVAPGPDEAARNPSARSAKMRAAEKM